MTPFMLDRSIHFPEAANDPSFHAEAPSSENLESLVRTISPFMRLEEYRRLYEITRQKGYQHAYHTYNDTFSIQNELFEPNPLIHAVVRDEYLAGHDPLTGLFSKRALKEEFLKRKEGLLHPQESRAEKDSRFWICLIDIDFFKTINDTHGHTVGDYALSAVAQSLRSLVREYDFLARYGGEEFVLLVEGSASDVFSLTERIRSQVERNSILFTNQENTKRLKITLTISIGISYCDRDPDKALEEADAALYHVKGKPIKTQRTDLSSANIIRDNGGRTRNRVCYYDKRENGFIFDPHV